VQEILLLSTPQLDYQLIHTAELVAKVNHRRNIYPAL